MTRDRIKNISKIAASRVAEKPVGTRPTTRYTSQIAELKKKRAAKVSGVAEPRPVPAR